MALLTFARESFEGRRISPSCFFRASVSQIDGFFSLFQPPASGCAQITGCYPINIMSKSPRDDTVIYFTSVAKYFHNSNRVKSPQFQEGKITVFSIGSLSVLFASIMFLPCTPHFAVVEFARFKSRSLEQFFR